MNNAIVPNRYLTIQEVAEALHVHERTVRRRIEVGDLAVVRTGRIIRIHPNELKRFISEGVSI